MTDAAVRLATDWMQVVDLLLAASILGTALWAMRRWRQARALLWGVVTVSVHGVVFHAATLLSLVRSPWVSLWSALLRAHLYAFLLATLIALIAVALSPGLDTRHDE